MTKNFSNPELVKNYSKEIEFLFVIFNREKKDSIRLVGGCVRDMMLGFKPKDFDFATIFLPEKIIEILEKNSVHYAPTGLKHGTISAIFDKKTYEITTLRKDFEHDGRRAKVEFVDDYFLDASRRDFTMNALYLDSNGAVSDFFEGIKDLQKSRVRFIGDASARIQEDYLRILRFFRFSCFYAKKFDEVGLWACTENKEQIKTLSSDRIRIEFFKILQCRNEDRLLFVLKTMKDLQILPEILLENVNLSNLQKLLSLDENLSIHAKFLCLISLSCKNLEEILVFFNFSNIEKKYFRFLHEKNSEIAKINREILKNLLVFYDKNWVRDFYLLKSIESSSNLDFLDFIDNFTVPEFPLNGQDLLDLGFLGKEIGEILQNAKKFWIDSDFKAQKSDLIIFATTNFKPSP